MTFSFFVFTFFTIPLNPLNGPKVLFYSLPPTTYGIFSSSPASCSFINHTKYTIHFRLSLQETGFFRSSKKNHIRVFPDGENLTNQSSLHQNVTRKITSLSQFSLPLRTWYTFSVTINAWDHIITKVAVFNISFKIFLYLCSLPLIARRTYHFFQSQTFLLLLMWINKFHEV